MTKIFPGSLGHRWRTQAASVMVVAAGLFWQSTDSKAADATIVASATDQSRVAAVSVIIMQRAYFELGYKLNVEYLPSETALEESNSGRTDAELVRIEAVGRKYANLVQVPEALFNVRGMAFTRDADMSVSSVQDMWGRRVGIVKGIQWATRETEGQSPILARNVHELFELLADGQIDIALESQLTGQPELKHFDGSGLVMLLGHVTQFPAFHFLNRKHADLLAPIAKELKEMKRRGDIRQILSTYLKTLESGHS